MDKMEYILVNSDNRVCSIVYVPVGDQHYMQFDNEEYNLIVTDSSGIPSNDDWSEWVYDPETGTFERDPEIQSLTYMDLETGKPVTMTESEFNDMVDEKVRNNVVAVLQELADVDNETIQKILNP